MTPGILLCRHRRLRRCAAAAAAFENGARCLLAPGGRAAPLGADEDDGGEDVFPTARISPASLKPWVHRDRLL